MLVETLFILLCAVLRLDEQLNPLDVPPPACSVPAPFCPYSLPPSLPQFCSFHALAWFPVHVSAQWSLSPFSLCIPTRPPVYPPTRQATSLNARFTNRNPTIFSLSSQKALPSPNLASETVSFHAICREVATFTLRLSWGGGVLNTRGRVRSGLLGCFRGRGYLLFSSLFSRVPTILSWGKYIMHWVGNGFVEGGGGIYHGMVICHGETDRREEVEGGFFFLLVRR